MLPSIANPSVTAGFRCAPLNCPTANTPAITAMPQPNVMTIQPLFCPLDWVSSTQATTPLPSRIRSAVPITSAAKILNALSSPPSDETTDGRHLGAPYDNVKPDSEMCAASRVTTADTSPTTLTVKATIRR